MDIQKRSDDWGLKSVPFGSVPVPIIQFPDIVFNYIDIWRDKRSNKWRIRFVDYVDSEGKIIEKKVNGTKKRYLKYDGALILIDKQKKYIDSDRRVKYVAVVKEYDPKTGWTTLFREITSCFDHSTPCLSMTDDMIDTNVRSFTVLRYELFNIDKFDALRVESDNKDFVFFKTVPNTGKVIKTTISPGGHNYYFYPPLALISEKNGQEILLEKFRPNPKPWEFIGFKQYGRYLLVAHAEKTNNGYVVDLLSGKVIFRAPKQSPVCWVSAPQFTCCDMLSCLDRCGSQAHRTLRGLRVVFVNKKTTRAGWFVLYPVAMSLFNNNPTHF